MDKIANLEASQRRELFQETAARKGIHPAVVEKDFWVCWVLKHIFEDPGMRSYVIFKGGTSLSKVFGLIERFSEDIDLILDWSLLGYDPGQQDPFPDDLSIYPCNWARYSEARPGTFKLIPPPVGIDRLEDDYVQMRVMIFVERPTFTHIIAVLQILEDEINGLVS